MAFMLLRHAKTPCNIAILFAFLLCLSTPISAQTAAERQVAEVITDIETTLDARVGVLILDTAAGWSWGHRQDERFLMASVFKSVLCGAILDRLDQGTLALEEGIEIHSKDILTYAPVTKEHVSETISIGALCLAALDWSDNTAANLLIARLGGVGGVMSYLADVGDDVTRLDRVEPDLNRFVPGDYRDTTSPTAILSTWEAMLLGDGLAPLSRAQLAEWMRHGAVTGALIRSSVPKGWDVVDKSGGGRHHTRNVVAMITPPMGTPYLVAIFVSDTPASWDKRNAAVARIGAAVMEVIGQRIR